jgi:hypothetical protein
MQGLGGVRFNWNVSGSSRKLESISYEYPVNGDVHESIVKLFDKSVSIYDHKITLDVASGDAPLLKFGAVLNEKKRAGAKVSSVWKINPPPVKEYVLSEIKGDSGSLFEPEHVQLLSQPAPESHVRSSTRYGDGAILVFMSFKGGVAGDRPYINDPNWRYMLDPYENGHSAILVLSNEWVVSRLVKHTFRARNSNIYEPMILDALLEISKAPPPNDVFNQAMATDGSVGFKWLLPIYDPAIAFATTEGELREYLYFRSVVESKKLSIMISALGDGIVTFNRFDGSKDIRPQQGMTLLANTGVMFELSPVLSRVSLRLDSSGLVGGFDDEVVSRFVGDPIKTYFGLFNTRRFQRLSATPGY